MLQRVVNVISLRVDEKQQKLSIYIDETVPSTLIGDSQRLAQVITNLLSNAVKFTSDHGSINFDARLLSEDNGICVIKIAVTDTGIGISGEQQERLFQSFQQAETSTARKFGGTGLGLSISKNIVEMMGGDIWVESELGKGSTFTFTVRAGRGTKEKHALMDPDINSDMQEKPEETQSNTSINFEGNRILLVEDMEINREIVLAMLEPLSLTVDCAETGAEAINKFLLNPDVYDMILMDVQMPGMDGYEATHRIRSLDIPEAKTIPIIALTANVFREDVEKCLLAGMNDHLGKPMDADALFEKIDLYLPKGRQKNFT
jgi:CheY-like chemotaxis protein/anti-sigma regulatory factor (Ser/Thr protein kinase)